MDFDLRLPLFAPDISSLLRANAGIAPAPFQPEQQCTCASDDAHPECKQGRVVDVVEQIRVSRGHDGQARFPETHGPDLDRERVRRVRAVHRRVEHIEKIVPVATEIAAHDPAIGRCRPQEKIRDGPCPECLADARVSYQHVQPRAHVFPIFINLRVPAIA